MRFAKRGPCAGAAVEKGEQESGWVAVEQPAEVNLACPWQLELLAAPCHLLLLRDRSQRDFQFLPPSCVSTCPIAVRDGMVDSDIW